MGIPQEMQVLRLPLHQRGSSRRTERRLLKDSQEREFTWQSAQGGKHTSKTKFGMETSCDSCRIRARIRFSRSPPTRSCPICPQHQEAGHGWPGSWGMSQMHLSKAASRGKPPSSTHRGEGTKSKALSSEAIQHGQMEMQTKSKVSTEHLFVMQQAQHNPHSLIAPPVHTSHLSPCPSFLEEELRVKTPLLFLPLLQDNSLQKASRGPRRKK